MSDTARGHSAGNPDDPRGDLLPGEADAGLSPASHWRPEPVALAALAILVVLFLGWKVTTWQVGQGSVVPCESFTPNPTVWNPATVAAAVMETTLPGTGDATTTPGTTPRAGVATTPRATTPTASAAGTTPRRVTESAVSWNAAVRETTGTVKCLDLVGSSQAVVELILGPPTDVRGTAYSEVNSLVDGDRAWAVTRRPPDARSAKETTAVIVRFRDGRVTSVRRFHRFRRVA